MKKVLFATTALVATAGMAAADVSLTGSAEMGIVDSSTTVNGVSTNADLQFLQSVDVRFTMTGESDNGLSFGATVDLDDATERLGGLGDSTGQFSDFTVFVSGNFGTLTMGDTDGALDWALTEVAGVGSIDDAETAHTGYNGNAGLDGFYNGQVLRYNYSIGGFGLALSAEIDNNGSADAASTATAVARQFDSTLIGIGANYTIDLGAGSLALGAGYQSADDANAYGLSASYSSNGLTIGVSAMNWSDTPVAIGNVATANAGNFIFLESGAAPAGRTAVLADVDHVGVGVTYEFDAFAVHANWGSYDVTNAVGSANTANYSADGYGLAASYDLGGGAAVHFGYGSGDRSGTLGGVAFNNDYDQWSLGVAMSF